MARTATVIQAEIDEITTALSQIRIAGQAYEITTASGFGSKRVVTMADYEKLENHRTKLYAELNTVNGAKSFRVKAGW